MKTSFGKLVGHSNIHTYAKYEIIWGNYHLKLAITSAIWLESHEPSYLIAHFEKTFLIDLHYSKFVGLYGYQYINQDATRRFYIFLIFLNLLSTDLKMWSKRGRGARPMIARCGILQNSLQISDEMSTCALGNVFLKK